MLADASALSKIWPVASEGRGVDLNDRLIQKLYDDYKINLVKLPRPGILPGQAFVGSGSGPGLSIVSLASLLSGNTALPKPEAPVRSGHVEGAVSDHRKVEAHGKVFGGWLSSWLPNVGKATANAEADKVGEFAFNFAEVWQCSIDVGKLRDALKRATLDVSGYVTAQGDGPPAVYVIVDTFSSKVLSLTWKDDSGNKMGASLAVERVAEIAAGRAAATGERGAITVQSNAECVFGVRLLEIIRTEAGVGLKLEHSRLSVLGGEREVDKRDYVMLPPNGV